MTEPHEDKRVARIDRIVGDVLAGRHLKATPSDATDQEAIRIAAALAGSREGYPRMSPAFRRRLTQMLQKGEAPAWISRRSALVAGLGLAAGAVGGALASEMAAPAGPRARARETLEPLPALGRWVDTGLTLADLEAGVPRRVTAGAIGAFLVRHGDQVSAMSALCTHLPCELVWMADRSVLNCPCHNLAFTLDGQPLSDRYPPPPTLPKVRVRVLAGGRLEVLGT